MVRPREFRFPQAFVLHFREQYIVADVRTEDLGEGGFASSRLVVLGGSRQNRTAIYGFAIHYIAIMLSNQSFLLQTLSSLLQATYCLRR